jgi:uncharacterized membrane protein
LPTARDQGVPATTPLQAVSTAKIGWLGAVSSAKEGEVLSSVSVGPRSPLAFQGTPDDARTLLLGITGTVITIIVLLLGLTVVALQLSSTQFSPRLLRNFLRDRPNQVVLSAFVATFAYSAAGLYTVGVSGGSRTAAFPRLAASGAGLAVPVISRCSGYVQAVRPRTLLPYAARHGVIVRLRPRVGEHIVAGTTLAWVWRPSADDPAPDPGDFTGFWTPASGSGSSGPRSRTRRSESGSSST